MIRVRVITVGALKEPFWKAATEEYKKRLQGLCQIELTELKEEKLPQDPSDAQIAAALDKEADQILAAVPKQSVLVAMAVEGRELSSEAFADWLGKRSASGTGSFTFVIGSSFGLSDRVKSQADMLLSVSKMTFPHHLMRPLLLEIIYRALSILAGTRYHK